MSELMLEGEMIYNKNCMVCHQSTGMGAPPGGPSLVGSAMVTGPAAAQIAQVPQGKGVMPSFADDLSDADIASIITSTHNYPQSVGQQGGRGAARGGRRTALTRRIRFLLINLILCTKGATPMTLKLPTTAYRRTLLPTLAVSAFIAGFGSTALAGPTDVSPPTVTTGKQASIQIVDFMKFTEEELTVDAGTTVTWTNLDGSNHKLVVDGAQSGRMNMNAQWSHTFDTPGTFPFACGLHPRMKGTITVQ